MDRYSSVDAVPAHFEMGEGETLPLGFDFGRLIAEGETITAVSSSLIRLDTQATVPDSLPSGPTSQGTIVTQMVTGIIPKVVYRLRVTATLSSGRAWSMYLTLHGV